MMTINRKTIILVSVIVLFFVFLISWFIFIPRLNLDGQSLQLHEDYLVHRKEVQEYNFRREHIKTPQNVRAVYYTQYAGLSDDKINWVIGNSEINSVVIDVKEVDGKVYLSDGIKANIKKLHQNNIYVIARIVVFKDNLLVAQRPELAVKKKSNQQEVWQDYRGKKWLDPAAKEVWDYTKELSSQAYQAGFDEINLDYIRFPSDGDMSDTFYPFSQTVLQQDPQWGKAKIIDRFFTYITTELKKEHPDIQISADVFGQVAINYDDVTIGQILESALVNFDYVAPMAYPSHYSRNHLGFADGPDNHPYEVIQNSYRQAQSKIDQYNAQMKTGDFSLRPNFPPARDTSLINELSYDQLRFWLQAFTCTWCQQYKPYTAVEVNAQKKALGDLGNHSWMLWNAASKY